MSLIEGVPAASLTSPAELSFRIPGVCVEERVHEESHLVLWQVRGSTLLSCGRESVELQQGHAVWVPAGTPHVLEVRPESVVFPLLLSVESVATVLEQVTVIPVSEDETLYFLALHEVQNTIIQPLADIERQVLSIMEGRALTGDELRLPTSREAAAVARALIFDPGDERRIDEWGASVRVSGRSLERAFAAETGMSFGQWRARNRMLTAERLLRAGSAIGSVARRVGYRNASAFSRAFRAHHALTPSEWLSREQRLAEQSAPGPR